MRSFVLILVFWSSALLAHPVIYKGGLMWGQFMTPDMTNIRLNYSFKYDWAYGVNGMRFVDKNSLKKEYAFAKLNHLVKRWNNKESQGNLYFHTGLGASRNSIGQSGFAYTGGVEADWESRVWYVSGKWMHFADKFDDQDLYVARIGQSPILAGVDQLQVWFVGQAMYQSYMSRSIKLTPLLRFFYHNVLWEAGSSLDGDWLLTFMVHY